MLSKELLLVILPIVLFSLSVHEYSHGYSAMLLGDKTAKKLGRLTLNPIKHLDLIGTLAILFIGIGWAKPVPVMVENLSRGRKRLWIVALAGPVSNFIIAIFFAVIFNLFDMSNDIQIVKNTRNNNANPLTRIAILIKVFSSRVYRVCHDIKYIVVKLFIL